jgi:hypothetical protein
VTLAVLPLGLPPALPPGLPPAPARRAISQRPVRWLFELMRQSGEEVIR